MKKFMLATLLSVLCMFSYSQADTVFTQTEILVGIVKEVGLDDIKFVYPKEEIVNVISKNLIVIIIFHSGRGQTYLNSSGSNMTYQDLGYPAEIKRIYQEGGFIMVEAQIDHCKQQTFRITYFDEEYFTLEYRDKENLYNLYIYWSS